MISLALELIDADGISNETVSSSQNILHWTTLGGFANTSQKYVSQSSSAKTATELYAQTVDFRVCRPDAIVQLRYCWVLTQAESIIRHRNETTIFGDISVTNW